MKQDGVKDKEKDVNRGSLLILVSSILWGSALLYTQYILDKGIDSKDLVSLKMLFGFLTMLIYILYKDKGLLKIDQRGLAYAALIGLLCHALFNLVVFRAIQETSIATMVTLLYTSPIFVTIISRILFKEKITTKKMIALILAVLGAWIIVTGGSFNSLKLNTRGIFYGLASSVLFATMAIINKFIVDDYEEVTLLIYTLGFAFIFSLVFSNPLVILGIGFRPLIYLFVIMLGVLPTSLSHLLYLKGLHLGVESSKASIISTFEVPVSIIGSFLIFGQSLSIMEVIGVLLVFTSMFIINENTVENQDQVEIY